MINKSIRNETIEHVEKKGYPAHVITVVLIYKSNKENGIIENHKNVSILVTKPEK